MTYNQELRFRQNRFATHVAWLLNFIQSPERGLTCSLGRALDIPEVQEILIKKGISSTKNSMHIKALAIDINFFEGDYYLFSDPTRKEKDFQMVLPVGEYWESLNDENVWGGRWTKPFDPYHFQNTFH